MIKRAKTLIAAILAATCTISVAGCGLFDNDNNTGGNGNQSQNTAGQHVQGSTTVKKGVASHRYKNGTEESANKLADLDVGWYYTWGSEADTTYTSAKNLEFVPMIWGAWQTNADTLNSIKEGYESGKYKYCLTFNEPDLPDQANMSVDTALSYWDDLEAMGIPLSSPAVSHYDAEEGHRWLDEFMEKAEAQGKRVDFIAIHIYQAMYRQESIATTVNDLKATMNALYEKYQRPIWLTEFGTIDIIARDTGRGTVGQYCTRKNTDDYIKQATTMLEQLGCVERYSWFLDNFNDRAGGNRPWEAPYTALYEDDDAMSDTGKTYKAIASNFPLEITTKSLPAAKVGQSYNQTVKACGGTGDYTFSATGLPAGLTIAKNGIISGKPKNSDRYTVKITVTDSGKTGRKQTLTYTYKINVT